MIKTFLQKGLKNFFEKGSMAGIQPAHAPRLAAMLRRLNETTNAQGMNLPGWGLHPLKGRELKGHFQYGLAAIGASRSRLRARMPCLLIIRIITRSN